MSSAARTQATDPVLLPLEDALAPYRGVSIRTARNLVASGKLPAVKVGRAYLVDPRDLANLLRPVARAPVGGIRRGEGPNAREDAQLAAAGFAVPPRGVDRRA